MGQRWWLAACRPTERGAPEIAHQATQAGSGKQAGVEQLGCSGKDAEPTTRGVARTVGALELRAWLRGSRQ